VVGRSRQRPRATYRTSSTEDELGVPIEVCSVMAFVKAMRDPKESEPRLWQAGAQRAGCKAGQRDSTETLIVRSRQRRSVVFSIECH
jgi:hypothetical protein